MARSDLPPIDRRARELAESGRYRDFESLEPVLIDQYGFDRVNEYRASRELRREINELCRGAYRGDE